MPAQTRTSLVRALRSQSTDAERRLWLHLRRRNLSDQKFRRQFPVGRYVVDFVCLEARLVVEVDGGQHAQARADLLRARGFRVLRFWNNEVLSEIYAVLGVIDEALRASTHPHPNLPPSRGKEQI